MIFARYRNNNFNTKGEIIGAQIYTLFFLTADFFNNPFYAKNSFL
jgi:hypothetical protein